MPPSPHCVMIVGDGFSRSFIHHAGLQDKVVTSTLFPPPVNVTWEPDPELGDGQLPCTSLSDRELFPYLWDAWDAFQQLNNRGQNNPKSERDFYGYISKNWRANPTFKDGYYAYTAGTPAAQFRSYLFYLFRHYFEIIETLKSPDLWPTWEWVPPLLYVNGLDTTYVSFNYDLVLETVLSRVLGTNLYFPTSADAIKPPDRKTFRSVLKPHGSISFHFPLIKIPTIGRPSATIENCAFANSIRVEFPPPKHPTIFDIVPPGHSLLDRVNPQFRLENKIRKSISNTDLLILCGLSAREPDTQEIRSYLSKLKSGTPTLHVGLSDDIDNPAGKLLQKFSRRGYQFIDASSGLQSIPSEVTRLLRRRS